MEEVNHLKHMYMYSQKKILTYKIIHSTKEPYTHTPRKKVLYLVLSLPLHVPSIMKQVQCFPQYTCNRAATLLLFQLINNQKSTEMCLQQLVMHNSNTNSGLLVTSVLLMIFIAQ